MNGFLNAQEAGIVMLRKIKLYGELAKVTGHKELEACVNTTAQAVSFLVNNFPELESHMANKYYQVLLGKENVNVDELHFPIGKSDIKFVPVVSGSGGLGKALLGGLLIGFSFGAFGFFGGIGSTTVMGGAATTFGAQAVFGIGASLALSGVSEMLFPLPKMPQFSSEQDPRLSFSFGGIQQTSRAGIPVPLVYGEIFTGSVVISGAIDTEQVQV